MLLPSGAVLQTLPERLSKMHSAMKIAACDKAIDEHLRYGRCAMERLRGRWEGKWNQFPLPDEFFTLPNEHRSSPLTGSPFFRDYQIRKASVRIWHGVFVSRRPFFFRHLESCATFTYDPLFKLQPTPIVRPRPRPVFSNEV